MPSIVDLLLELPQRYVPVGFLRFRRVDFVPVGPVAQLLEGWVGPLAWFALLVAGAIVAGSVRERPLRSATWSGSARCCRRARAARSPG